MKAFFILLPFIPCNFGWKGKGISAGMGTDRMMESDLRKILQKHDNLNR
jgi:hypothetical protein